MICVGFVGIRFEFVDVEKVDAWLGALMGLAVENERIERVVRMAMYVAVVEERRCILSERILMRVMGFSLDFLDFGGDGDGDGGCW